jgi:dolichyl-phosphate-mannose--protein O-mannosyl transferase
MKYHLHSHPINYGSGSGQQAVTALKSDTDTGSLWTVKETDGSPMCLTGDTIMCGDSVRLEHMNTGKNLHSHSFKSPVSGRQEVSGYGENGEGDSSDNWILECHNSNEGDDVTGNSQFYIKHQSSGQYLYTDKSSLYNDQNCRNCPIIGQSEISTGPSKSAGALWQIVSGYFYTPNKIEGFEEMDDDNMGDVYEDDYDEKEDL